MHFRRLRPPFPISTRKEVCNIYAGYETLLKRHPGLIHGPEESHGPRRGLANGDRGIVHVSRRAGGAFFSCIFGNTLYKPRDV